MDELLATHPRLIMFAQNVCLLIFLLTIAVVGLVLLVATWTGTKVLVWKRDQARSETEYRRNRYDEHGMRLPDAGRGVCDGCQSISNEVLYLSDGTRRCRMCYDAARAAAADPAPVDH
jgi:hypothetical protein